MKRTKISEIWAPELIGTDVCVKGWVRTRRGNKHVQFVALNDGSTIKNLQIVFDMEKFSDEDLKPITTGASIHVEGKLVESQGKGQTAEVQAETLEIYGTADPETYPLQKKRTHSRIPAREGSSASAHKHFRRGAPYTPHVGLCNPQILQRPWFLLSQHAAHHIERLRGCRRDVSSDNA